ncbi:phosphoribosyl-AMP cyclohydrolase [Oecophyllibacter saccharovorans]|uniref:phosphoribosyl-AMP cyclohydrolase n=1 Tax=Oecophyllibacter saccharovorans TaxID=2558360 RepID=UPI00387E9E0D
MISPDSTPQSSLQDWQPPSPEQRRALVAQARFDAEGLLAAIAQDEDRNVLMLAWMNSEALDETLRTGRVCYFSRSRQRLWRKGESSGQVQHLLKAAFDCDCDALLLTVHQTGVACHTGRRSCFYQNVTPEGLQADSAPLITPTQLYGRTDSGRS